MKQSARLATYSASVGGMKSSWRRRRINIGGVSEGERATGIVQHLKA